jgi:hypothetical protein
VIGNKHTFKDVVTIERVADKIRTMGHITDPTKSKELSDRDYALLGMFYALDKPFQNRVSNCLDINRIFPDSEGKPTSDIYITFVRTSCCKEEYRSLGQLRVLTRCPRCHHIGFQESF